MSLEVKFLITIMTCVELTLLGLVGKHYLEPNKTVASSEYVVEHALRYANARAAASNNSIAMSSSSGQVLQAITPGAVSADPIGPEDFGTYIDDEEINVPRPTGARLGQGQTVPFDSGFDTSEFQFQSNTPAGSCIGQQIKGNAAQVDLSSCVQGESARVGPGITTSQTQANANARNTYDPNIAPPVQVYVPRQGLSTAVENCISSLLGGTSVSSQAYQDAARQCDQQVSQRFSQYQSLAQCVTAESNIQSGSLFQRAARAQLACEEYFNAQVAPTPTPTPTPTP